MWRGTSIGKPLIEAWSHAGAWPGKAVNCHQLAEVCPLMPFMLISIKWSFRESKRVAPYHMVSEWGPESQPLPLSSPYPLFCFL